MEVVSNKFEVLDQNEMMEIDGGTNIAGLMEYVVVTALILFLNNKCKPAATLLSWVNNVRGMSNYMN